MKYLLLVMLFLGCVNEQEPTQKTEEPNCKCGTVKSIMVITFPGTHQREYEYRLVNYCSFNIKTYTSQDFYDLKEQVCLGNEW